MVNDKRRRRSIRLRGYDYSQPGAYFVTVCSEDRQCIWGDIAEGQMKRNLLGDVVLACWANLPHHFPYVELDAFVVMPNHVHGIVVITHRRGEASGPNTRTPGLAAPDATPLPHPDGTRPGSLGAIVQNFKSVSTRRINTMRSAPGAPVWQRNYYEHVVRNERELDRIRQYIILNPSRWAWDRQNPAAISMGLPEAPWQT
ncbi:MAG: hypothetical protein Q8P50_07410 [Bacillota bacterium]|nr:hypothetical protein [Bacillota bacterium]